MKALLLFLTINGFSLLQIWCQDIKFEQVIPINSPQLRAEFSFNSTVISFADIDNDNDQDLICVEDYETLIYINDGSGNFTLKKENPIKGYKDATSINFADINGDSYLDFLITANFSLLGARGPFSFLYLNDGNGEFSLANNNFNVGINSSTKFSDVDNDGDMDVLISGRTIYYSDFSTKLFLNDGSGKFIASSQKFLDVWNPAIAFGDLDADLDNDLVYIGSTGSGFPSYPVFKIFTNDGQGVFTEKTNHSIPPVENGLVKIVDMNNDSYSDIIISGKANGDVKIARIYYNDGQGGFKTNYSSFPVDYGNGNETIPVSFVSGDIDNDGDEDLIITGEEINAESSPRLFINNGDETFTLQDSTFFGKAANNSISILGDTDGDNDLDLIVTGTENNDFSPGVNANSYYINNGNGTFEHVKSCDISVFNSSTWNMADLNNDGYNDLLISGKNGDQNIFLSYLNNGNGNFIDTTLVPSSGIYLGDIEFADVENDGDIDVFVIGKDRILSNIDEKADLYLNNGDGTFEGSPRNNPFIGTHRGSVNFADIDNDGDDDLFVTGSEYLNKYHSEFYMNDGKGNYTLMYNDSIPNVSESFSEFHDYDNDGDLDLLLFGNQVGNQVGGKRTSEIFINDGYGKFNTLPRIPLRSLDHTERGCIVSKDLDLDGDIDIFILPEIIVNQQANAIVYLNNGNLDFSEVEKPLALGYEYGNFTCSMGDVNGDKYPDLFINGRLLFLNDGLANFTLVPNTSFTHKGNFSSSKIIDIDNDGDNDIITFGYRFGRVYRNITCDLSREITVEMFSNHPFDSIVIRSLVNYKYQWLQCDSNMQPLIGDTLSAFVPYKSGDYSVEIKFGFCTDTINCFSIEKKLFAPALAKDNKDELFILPNPAKNEISVTNFEIENSDPLRVFSFDGVLKMEVLNYLEGQKINISNLEQGIYIIKYQSKTQKFIVVQ